MSLYKGIRGFKVQTLASDTAASLADTGSWSSGGNLNDSRRYFAGIGSSTAGLVFGGEAPAQVTSTEQYNGTAWTEVNNLNAAQIAHASAGTLTSGMSALGALSPGSNVEDWNGSSWATNPHSLNSARQFPGGDGASNDSAIMVGGEPAPNGALTEIYNGSSWTESGDLNTARNQLAAAGTVTALIAIGGNTGADAETFNGSSWTAVTDMNSGRGGLCGSGTSTLALAFAGNPDVAKTENWNGSAWTELNDLSTGREFGASSNITGNTSAFMAGGHTTTYVANTEEWTVASSLTKINLGQVYYNETANAFKVTEQSLPTGTWASGGALNTARYQIGGDGSSTAAIVAGGDVYPASPRAGAITEIYNGSTWTEVNDVNHANQAVTNFGTTTSSIYVAGANPTTYAESWNGSNWTEITTINSARSEATGTGTSTAGILIGGGTPGGKSTLTEFWNGSAWTETTDINTARSTRSSGIQTSALIVGGETTPGAFTANCELWNGTSWTETTDINTARKENGVAAENSSSALTYGGNTPPITSNTEAWNGSTWTEVNNYPTANRYLGNAGSATAALGFGGFGSPTTITTTADWNVSEANSTITVS